MYLERIMNPNSPFIDEPEEEMTFSKEHGKLVLELVETPGTYSIIKNDPTELSGRRKKKPKQRKKKQIRPH